MPVSIAVAASAILPKTILARGVVVRPETLELARLPRGSTRPAGKAANALAPFDKLRAGLVALPLIEPREFGNAVNGYSVIEEADLAPNRGSELFRDGNEFRTVLDTDIGVIDEEVADPAVLQS